MERKGLTLEEHMSLAGTDEEGYIQFERQKADELGFFGTVGDVAKGVLHGATDAVDETIQFGAGIIDGAVERTGDAIGKDWDLIDDESYRGEMLSSFVPRPVTATGKVVEDFAQFGVGLFGASKITKAIRASGLGMAKKAATGSTKRKVGRGINKALDKKVGYKTETAVLMGESAVAALIVQDPYEDTLAEVMQQTPELSNPVAKYLANEIDDSELTRRLKNLGEDVLLSFGIEQIIRGVKATRTAFSKSGNVVEEAATPFKRATAPTPTNAVDEDTIARNTVENVTPEVQEAAIKEQSTAEAAVVFKAHVDTLPPDDSSVLQTVLDAAQAGRGTAETLPFLSKEEIIELVRKSGDESLGGVYEEIRHLRMALGKGEGFAEGLTFDELNILQREFYVRLGKSLDDKAEGLSKNPKEGVADDTVKTAWDTLKASGKKQKKQAEEPTGSPKKEKEEEGVEPTAQADPQQPPESKIDLEIPPEVIATIKTEMEAMTITLKGKKPEDLHEDYMALIKDATRGLSGKYWDTPETEKALTEHLRVHVFNPVFKDLMGTKSFTKVRQAAVNKAAATAGISNSELSQMIARAGVDVEEASTLLMVHELRINDAWKDMMKTMDALDAMKEGMAKVEANAELLLQVSKLAEMSNAGSMLESAFGAGLGQRRMTFKAVKDMDDIEIKRILDTVSKDPEKSKVMLGELKKNLRLADNDIIKAAKIAKEFGKYQGVEKFMASMTEMWRGALLMNFSTNITNMMSGFAESFIIPIERIIGSSPPFNMSRMDGKFQWNPAAKEAHDQAWLHLRNMREGFSHGFVAMNYAFKHEFQSLDPFKGGMIETPGKGMAEMTHAEMQRGSPFQMTAENWGFKDDSFIGTMINTTGKTFRMSFRFLGAQDELIKQTTYWASLKAKHQMAITKRINAGEITRLEGRKEVAKLMKDHFEADGFTPKMGKDGNLATDGEALEMARDVTHTKAAYEGSVVQNMQTAVNTNPALGIFLPFIRTPSDLINKAYQRTPFLGGFSKRLQKDWTSQDPNLRAQARGRQAVGFGIVGMGLMAVQDGKLTGKGPDDPRANKIWRLTHQPNSIMVDGKWVSYNKFDPSGMLLGMLANGMEAANNQALTEGTDAGDIAQAMILAVTATIGDKSSLRGLINLTTLFSDQVIGKEEATGNILEDHTASWVPSILTQVSGAFQDTSYIKEADGFIEKLMRKSPWHQNELSDRYNWITGEKEKIPTGNSWGIPVKEKSHDWVLIELGNLNHGFSGPTRSFSGIELSSAQFSEWSRLMGNVQIRGRTMLQQIEATIKSRRYNYDPNRRYFQEMYGDDPEQVSMIKRVMRSYKAEAKRLLLINNPDLIPQDDDYSSLFGG
jgi:hypothetical protein